MKIYTKTGDKGKTSLLGGNRVDKDSIRIEAYGTVDELNCFIGLAAVEVKDKSIYNLLIKIQNSLFSIGSELAAGSEEIIKKYNLNKLNESEIHSIENEIDNFNSQMEQLGAFILPGGSKISALLHICRTVCRRAERNVVSLSKKEKIDNNIIVYLNRLSDLFFVLARYCNKLNGIEDIKWQTK